MAGKKAYEYKRECHRLMEQIWGTDKKGRSAAYIWLRNEFGKEVHFSDINDVDELHKIHAKLFSYSVMMDSQRMIEEIAPAWDAWLDHKATPRRSKRFNQRRGRQLAGWREY